MTGPAWVATTVFYILTGWTTWVCCIFWATGNTVAEGVTDWTVIGTTLDCTLITEPCPNFPWTFELILSDSNVLDLILAASIYYLVREEAMINKDERQRV